MKFNRYTTLFLITTVILAVLLIVNKAASKQAQYDSSTVLNRIVHVQELALVKYNYAGVIGFKDYMKVMGVQVPLTEKFFLLKYNGYIKAGVDLANAQVKADKESVQVLLPKPKIMDTVIDEKSIRVYDESMNPFNPVSITEYNQAIIKEKETMTRDALNQGILREASKQAHLIISGILKDMNFKNIEIKETDIIALPERK